jgi:tRNA(fMet)-specific endonuclease VapC
MFSTNMMGHFLDHRHGVDEKVRQIRRRGEVLGTCFPVVAELSFGAEFSVSRDLNRARLIRGLSRIRCWPFDRPAAEEDGRIAAHLKRTDRPMQQIDMMIAAIALTLGRCTVVTADSDFAAVPWPQIENWVA